MNYLKTRGMYLSVEWLQIDCKLLQKKIYVSVREWQCERTESIFFSVRTKYVWYTDTRLYIVRINNGNNLKDMLF